MSKIYWNKKEMNIPEGGHIDHSDGSVYFYLNEGKTIRTSRKRVIGHAASETTMYPNEYFRQTYPSLWKEVYGEESSTNSFLKTGLFSLALGIDNSCGIYQKLIDVYGPETANAIMDYSMYSILSKSNVAMEFEDRMRDEELFSRKRLNRNDIGKLFNEELDKEKNISFKKEWIKKCVELGKSDVWICVDGSNLDFSSNIEEAEKGYDKSDTKNNIMGLMYAVSADDGLPLCYTWYNGSKAFMEMIAFLLEFNVQIKGIIIDKGFCYKEDIEAIKKLGYPYVVILKSDVFGYKTMMERHASKIHWKVDKIIDKNGLFGISEQAKIFKDDNENTNIALYFDGKNGTDRSITLLNKFIDSLNEAKQSLLNGKQINIPQELSEYIKYENGTLKTIDNELQLKIDSKGYSAIASSTITDPIEINRIYHLRDASETQYMIMKSQLGNNVMRVHSSPSIEGKMMACFVSSIIRSYFMNACKKNDLITNKMIVEIDRIHLYLDSTGIYRFIHDESKRQKLILESFGINNEVLDAITGEINGRMKSTVFSQERKIPEIEMKAKPGRKKKIKEENKEKRMRGRPKGSKNKKTIEREKNGEIETEKIRRGRGRPKGSKNKKTNKK